MRGGSGCCGGPGRARTAAASIFAAVVLGLALLTVWTGTASAASASVVYRGSIERKQIALTFDDNTITSRALATLRALERDKVPATLFVIGSAVEAYPAINAEIIRGMTQSLFEVGDHTWSHPVLPGLSTSAMAGQIGGGTDAFRKATGARTVPLFRPPYGSTNSQVAAVAGSEGFRYLVLWDVDPRDWAGGSANSIANHIISHAHKGAIVVMHLSAPHTAAAIPTIVSTLRAKGYEFVTISTMLKGDRLFLDVDTGTETGKAIARMVQEGFMGGYNGNYFGPGDTITRAQVAKVAVLVGGLHTATVENEGTPTFADVPLLHDPQGNSVPYPFDFVEEAVAAGLVRGSPDASGIQIFRPNDRITRLQLAQIISRMAQKLKGYRPLPPGSEAPSLYFSDVPDYAYEDVSLVVRLGLMSRSGDRFNSWQGASRAQVAVVMSRYLDLSRIWPPD